MRILAISDIHGMTFWKEAIANAESSDQIVFLGDYFDKRGNGPYANSQTDNFLEICSLARNNPNVHLLMGNHDFQYTDLTSIRTTSFDECRRKEYNNTLMENIDLLQIVYIVRQKNKQIIFSHAGVTQDFLEYCNIHSVDEINRCFKNRPWRFEFLPHHKGEQAENHGDNVWQTPLWVRPKSLLKAAIAGYEQVVGHTQVSRIEEKKSVHGDKIYLTCTFDANCLVLNF